MPVQFDLRSYANPVFIETGYWRGNGVEHAIAAGFSLIASVEISRSRYLRGRRRFRAEITAGQVQLYHGDSPRVLKELLGGTDQRITFWLDAHISCRGRTSRSPPYGELDVIAQHSRNDHTILIDDRRQFPEWNLEETEVRKRLLAINPRYHLRTEANELKGTGVNSNSDDE